MKSCHFQCARFEFGDKEVSSTQIWVRHTNAQRPEQTKIYTHIQTARRVASLESNLNENERNYLRVRATHTLTEKKTHRAHVVWLRRLGAWDKVSVHASHHAQCGKLGAPISWGRSVTMTAGGGFKDLCKQRALKCLNCAQD